MSTLGIDIGTSGCRTVAFDDDLRALASSQRDYNVRYPASGRAELDPTEVLTAVAICIRETNAALHGENRVDAIGVAALGEAVIAVDRAERPLGPAPVSADLRGSDLTAAIEEKLGGQHWRALTGQPVHPMFSITKVAHWRDDPDIWNRIARIHTFADFVVTWLGGQPAMDYTSASRTAAFDVNLRAWDANVLDIADVDPILLPEPVPVGTPVGTVTADQKRDLGFDRTVSLFAGAHDQACAFWGGGGTSDHAVFSLGTTECLITASRHRPEHLITANIASYPIDNDDEWLSLNGIPSGGSTLHWLASFAGFDDRDAVRLVDAMGDKPSPVLLLPHFGGSGTVDNDPLSVGAAIGLTLGTTVGDLASAVFEASGYELARNLAFTERAGLAFSAVRAVGGGASPAALQRRADASDRTLTYVPGPSAARGAAVVAMVGSGRLPSRTGAASVIHTSADYVPRPDHRPYYAIRRCQYERLYPAIRSVLTEEKPLS